MVLAKEALLVRPLREGRRGSKYCRLFIDGKKTERPLLLRANTGSNLAKYLHGFVLEFPHLKQTATSWAGKLCEGRSSHASTDRHRMDRKRGDEHVSVERRRAIIAAILMCEACLGGSAQSTGSNAIVGGGSGWSAYPHCRVYPKAEENGAARAGFRRRTQTINDGSGAWIARFYRRKNTWLRGTHARSAGLRRRYYAVRIVNRRRRSPWVLGRGNMCCAIEQAINRYISIF